VKPIQRILNGTATILEWIVAMTFFALFAVTLLNIGLRNLGGVALLWIPGFIRLMFVWTVFLGIAAVFRRGDHLVVDVLLNRFVARAKTLVLTVIHLSLLPFFGVLFHFGLQVAEVRMRIPFDTWDFPTGWAYMAVPVSAVFLLVFTLERLVILWRGELTK